jgi:cation diffusion facilitator CzcD-associated flavoprotein CzcO
LVERPQLLEPDRSQTEADERVNCQFLYVATGYYDHDAGHSPDLPGASRFGGRIVHP